MRTLFTLLTCVIGFVLLAAPTVSAQAQEDDTMIVEVPFDFVAGDRELPRGTYRIEVLPDAEDPAIVTLETAAAGEKPDEKIFQNLSTTKIDVSHDASLWEDEKLVFSKVGDLYFLERIELS